MMLDEFYRGVINKGCGSWRGGVGVEVGCLNCYGDCSVRGGGGMYPYQINPIKIQIFSPVII